MSGLVGSGLLLANNGDNPTPVSANGPFSFSRRATPGNTYAVTVTAQPESPAQICTVARGSGTLADADITDIDVSCVTTPPVSLALHFASLNPKEVWLWVDVTGDATNHRFEVLMDGQAISCCGMWGPSTNLSPARAHAYALTGSNTPYMAGAHVYEARLLDVNGTVVAHSSVSAGTRMDNLLVNGSAEPNATSGWTVELGQPFSAGYGNSAALLFNYADPLPFERFSSGAGQGLYFSTEGATGNYVEMTQRITLAFPGVTDGSTAIAWGGWFGDKAGQGVARMELTLRGQNADGSELVMRTVQVGGPRGGSPDTPGMRPDWRYGQIPPGIQFADVRLVLDPQASGAAFADNLYVSQLPWPH